MPSMKIIKRRIASVTTTKKIMKAMNMVAASKLQKDKAHLQAAQPFFDEMQTMMHALKNSAGASGHGFFVQRPIQNRVYLIITSDRGLCGSYNTKVIAKALAGMRAVQKETPANEKIVVVGQRGYESLMQHNKNVVHKINSVPESDFFEGAAWIYHYLSELYNAGEADEVYVAYTHFESALVHMPIFEKILPIECNTQQDADTDAIRYEPDIVSYLDHAVPLYLIAFLYKVLIESSACKQAARMISMDTAVNNAADIIHKLTRVYNRRRQAAITQEIVELMGNTRNMKQ